MEAIPGARGPPVAEALPRPRRKGRQAGLDPGVDPLTGVQPSPVIAQHAPRPRLGVQRDQSSLDQASSERTVTTPGTLARSLGRASA
jgi:hypothetical protein